MWREKERQTVIRNNQSVCRKAANINVVSRQKQSKTGWWSYKKRFILNNKDKVWCGGLFQGQKKDLLWLSSCECLHLFCFFCFPLLLFLWTVSDRYDGDVTTLAKLSTHANRWAGLNRQWCRSRCWSSSVEAVFSHTITSKWHIPQLVVGRARLRETLKQSKQMCRGFETIRHPSLRWHLVVTFKYCSETALTTNQLSELTNYNVYAALVISSCGLGEWLVCTIDVVRICQLRFESRVKHVYNYNKHLKVVFLLFRSCNVL